MSTLFAGLLALSGLVCIFLIFLDTFRDNLGQRLGMAVVALVSYPVSKDTFMGYGANWNAIAVLAMGIIIFIASSASWTQLQREQHEHEQQPIER